MIDIIMYYHNLFITPSQLYIEMICAVSTQKFWKILLLPPKYEIMMVPSNHSFAILDFFLLLLVKLSLLILFASFFVLFFFFYGSLFKVTALLTIARDCMQLHAVMCSQGYVKPFLRVETSFFVWNLISVYTSRKSNNFFILTT